MTVRRLQPAWRCSRNEHSGKPGAVHATDLGVHQVTVARWETGARGIPEPVARLVLRLVADPGSEAGERRRAPTTPKVPPKSMRG